MKRGLVGAEVSADHTGSNRCLPVLCCGFKQTLSYKRMYTYVFIRARAHTGPACSCVLVSSALGSCGLAGFSNTHALCLCCARRPPVVWPHTIPAHLQHHIAPKYLFSCRPLTATPGFDILIRLKNYVQPLFRLRAHTDDRAHGADLVIRPRCAVIFSPPLVFFHPVNFPKSLLLSPPVSQLFVFWRLILHSIVGGPVS